MNLNKNNESKPKKPLDKTTLLSYIGIGSLLILILIPPLFRVMFPKPVEKEEKKEIIRLFLECRKNDLGTDYVFTKRISHTYEDNIIVNSIFSFEVSQRPGSAKIPVLSDVETTEIAEFDALTDTNIKKTKTDVKESFEFDYKKYDFSKLTFINNHKKVVQAQLNIYRTDGYSCDTHTEIIEIKK